ncbi:YozE family protein [Staphylococcus pettenkoferi]|uniref:YozE family protein n=1 Tax=Staphylococcus pettenkoferi TaxID=170573 RepID=UPI0025570DF4|nr:YozE family protein [Staphylococcus pettenkoferi]MDK7115598.1 YozE family protein [Staphylococcus pettenkoferi]
MTFYEFIYRFLEDDTPLGYIAHHVHTDSEFPIEETCAHSLFNYFSAKYVERDMLEYAKRAISIYNDSNCA